MNSIPDNTSRGNRRRSAEGYLIIPADFLLRHRGIVKLFLHFVIFAGAYHLAYLIRFDFIVPLEYGRVIRETILYLLIAKAIGFLAFGLFQGWWRFVSIRDVLPIAAGCTAGSAIFAGVDIFFLGNVTVPRSVYLLDWGITLLVVLASRYLIRMGREAFGRRHGEFTRRVLIVGAGAAGQMIAREIHDNPALGMIDVGYVDDDKAKIGTRIQGLRVLGGHEEIDEICRAQKIDEIIIAIPSARASKVRHIVDHCRESSARFRILPAVGELIDGKASVSVLRNVNIEDLLGRDQVRLDMELLRRDITGQTVMVTGAAGSIGSELCRQVAKLFPSKLVMFEIAESPLFELELEMREKFPGVNIVPLIGDIRDRKRVEIVISAHRPSLIYHAAAYKHVPVMEVHPIEAVKNNVLGTQVVAEVAAEYGVPRFVLVSTDKAVRPTNVMGATKRVAEMIVQNMNGKGKETTYVSVRFGNVLDSVGSVLPIFRKQLETTGKLTVTHPEASRYFMLIPEAAGLILQAGAMGRGGEVFVLDMGQPVKIVDLAENLIRLMGKELGVDAEIVFTGLRPGEKLHEELVIEGEDVTRTAHPKVMKMIGNGALVPELPCFLEELFAFAIEENREGVIRKLSMIVKGYRPDYLFHGIAAPHDQLSADSPKPAVVSPPSSGSFPPKTIH
ncbi:MAG: nucleoside-diphosphate sugar epimerase/dehydratase [Candidatus Deferrimicrobiaceae bacterium]